MIYFSDNGPNGWRWNGGMKGRKGSTDEGGVRSPFIIRWPGHIPAGTRVPQIAGAIDLQPTLANLAGVPSANGKPLDGIDLTPLLMGTAQDWPDRMIFSHWSGKTSARTQRHRLDAAGKLFDMGSDPGQDRDIAQEQPDIAARLAKAVAEWRDEMRPGLKHDGRPFAVGGLGFSLTQLPARDGEAHGGIRRSASVPNCSYFDHWTRPADSITWDVEVATAGRYEAVVLYTCPAADVGSTVELSFNGSRVEGVVSEAHDPPLRGAENDRVPRKGESYVKDFKPLSLGIIELKSGRGPLTLRAVRIPGGKVIEVRGIQLKRLP